MNKLPQLAAQTGASSIAVMQVDKDKKLLVCADSYNQPDAWDALTNPLDDSTMNGRVWGSGKSLVANNLSTILEGYPVTAVLIVPIKRDRAVIGTLELISNQPGKEFSDKDLEATTRYVKSEGSSLLR